MSRSVLRQVTLFADFSDEDFQALAGCLRRRRCAKDQIIFVQGDPGTCLYIVEEGRVRISLTAADGKELVLAVMGPGDFFGELALLDGEPRSADAVAQEACQILLLPRDDFVRFLEERPKVMLHLLATLSHRLRNVNQLAHDAVFLDVPARLARALLRMADDEGKTGQDGPVIGARLTQTALAGLIGATRESINKWLGFYERQGMISYNRGSITLLRQEELRRRVY